MCQAKPGPRCSPHARKAVNKAQAEMYQAMQEYEGLVRGPKQGNLDSKDWEESDKLMNRISAATEKYSNARRNYDSTPEGIKELETAYNEAVTSGADETITRDLSKRLHNAQGLRERRIEAAKFVKRLQEGAASDAERNAEDDIETGENIVTLETYEGDSTLQEEYLQSQKQHAQDNYTRAITRLDKSLESGKATRLEWRGVRKAHERVLRVANVAEGVKRAQQLRLTGTTTDTGTTTYSRPETPEEHQAYNARIEALREKLTGTPNPTPPEEDPRITRLREVLTGEPHS